MPFGSDLSRVLTNAPRDTRLRVHNIAFDLVRRHCAGHDLHEGDEITCRRHTRESVVIELASRRTVEIGWELGTFIEVEPVHATSE